MSTSCSPTLGRVIQCAYAAFPRTSTAIATSIAATELGAEVSALRQALAALSPAELIALNPLHASGGGAVSLLPSPVVCCCFLLLRCCTCAVRLAVLSMCARAEPQLMRGHVCASDHLQVRFRQRRYGQVYEVVHPRQRDIHLSLWVLPKGTRLPLHDHPGMTVFMRHLYGELEVRCFDWADKTRPEHPATAGVARLSQLIHWRDPLAGLHTPTPPNERSVACFRPRSSNLHEIHALSDGMQLCSGTHSRSMLSRRALTHSLTSQTFTHLAHSLTRSRTLKKWPHSLPLTLTTSARALTHFICTHSRAHSLTLTHTHGVTVCGCAWRPCVAAFFDVIAPPYDEEGDSGRVCNYYRRAETATKNHFHLEPLAHAPAFACYTCENTKLALALE
jgi:PCO_ADO